ALFVALEDLVASLARDAELAAQRGHTLTVLEPDHESHPFVHDRTLLPWHPPSPSLRAEKCNPCLRNVLLPMSRNGHNQSPVGIMPAFSTIRMTVRCGARVRCTVPFGTTNPCRGARATVPPSRSIRSWPSTT